MNIDTIRNNIKQNINVYDDEIWNSSQYHINKLNSYIGLILSDIIHEQTGSQYSITLDELDRCALNSLDKDFTSRIDHIMEETRELVCMLYKIADTITSENGKEQQNEH